MPTPTPEPPESPDRYSRLQYRRFVAWPARIRREEPFLLGVLAAGPERSLLDLGCGTGEHALHFAAAGFRVVGVDLEPSQIEVANREARDLSARFVTGDLAHLPDLGERFGTALCIGNTLVHLLEEEDLAAACRGVHAALLPGGSWVVQILNYAAILGGGKRHLPLNFQTEGAAELVFLRLLRGLPDRRIQFVPTTLRLDPAADPPVVVLASRCVTLRAWVRADLDPALRDAGFSAVRWYGDMTGGDFDADTSSDLVFVATRPR